MSEVRIELRHTKTVLRQSQDNFRQDMELRDSSQDKTWMCRDWEKDRDV